MPSPKNLIRTWSRILPPAQISISIAVYHHRPVFGHKECCIDAFENRASTKAFAERQRFPAVDFCLAATAAPENFARSDERVGRIGTLQCKLGQSWLRHFLSYPHSKKFENTRRGLIFSGSGDRDR